MGFSERLVEERNRLGLQQNEFADRVPVTPRSQRNYEKGEREPDASYLMAIAVIGVDVLYVLTGQRSKPVESRLSKQQQRLLKDYEDAGDEGRLLIEGTARMAAKTGKATVSKPSSSVATQNFHGPVSGGVAGRDIVNKGKK